MSSNQHPFDVLTPDCVLQAVENQGLLTDGRILALNSYENRVYQVGIEDAVPIIVKFYRPQRWSDKQILEEHQFSAELAAADFPVVCPQKLDDGRSLIEHVGLKMAMFERRGGRAPELDNLDNLFQLGQYMGRLHAVGELKDFQHRPTLDIKSFGYDSVDTVCNTLLPDYLKEAYQTLCADLLTIIEQRFANVANLRWIRCHGDCHVGNILWRDDKPHFVDFDDARMAPAIQDLWMLLSGSANEQQLQMNEIIEGYEMFMPFNAAELALIEPLRTLRLMHYSAWLAKRWGDPAFPMHFPWFNTEIYWGQHILELREQLSVLQEPGLQLNR
ncbi:MAG: serine/threonine protein kinase [Pseudomonadales bacterium]|nr:serine/threonine protein kinase [Pseudomonadales bacterium]